MTFHDFWPLYLRAHRLPGTRVLHYVATIIGIAATIDAVVTLQPLIFVAGVPLSYCLAIGSHRLIEGNQPLIRVNVAWGALADLRMCWMAITGKLDAELATHGLPAAESASAETAVRPWAGAVAWRHALTMTSAAGVVAAVADLHDLIEPTEILPYPAIQLGVPIIAFAAAFLASCGALLAARRLPAAMTALGGCAAPLPSGSETSLQRACLVLLMFGAVAFGLAELVEHVASAHALAGVIARGHPLA